MAGRSIIVMGVSGCGKSTIGEGIAHKLQAKFIDGDDLHPKANIQKMASGIPLNDNDRAPWLERIRDAAYSIENKNEIGVIVCSALKKQYRDQIRDGNQHIQFVFLDGSKSLILERIRTRKGHFMRETMLDSQLETLERPNNEKDVITVNIDQPIANIINEATAHLIEGTQ